MVPGNHDVSNAIGFYRPMAPAIDKTAMVEIYNLMMAPSPRKTTATYTYPSDKVLVSHDVGGMHFMFITMWPDSGVRSVDGARPRTHRSRNARHRLHARSARRRGRSTSPTRTARTTSTPPTSSRTCSSTGLRTARRWTRRPTSSSGPAKSSSPASPEHHRVLSRQLELEPVLRLDRPRPRRRPAHVPRGLADEGRAVVEGRDEAVVSGGDDRHGVAQNDRPRVSVERRPWPPVRARGLGIMPSGFTAPASPRAGGSPGARGSSRGARSSRAPAHRPRPGGASPRPETEA